jgi:hypothetical protein
MVQAREPVLRSTTTTSPATKPGCALAASWVLRHLPPLVAVAGWAVGRCVAAEPFP